MSYQQKVQVKLHDILTNHNSDGNIVSILGVVAFVFFIAFTGHTVYKSLTFDPLTHNAGAAALIASIGSSYRLKSGQTPPSSL